jgi:CheY-like chemotaxis protein
MKAKVLLVEDDLDVSRMYQYKFAEKEFLTSIAMNGQECLEALELDVPDVILLDLKMPVMNGFQVLRRLRAEPRWQHIPVVVCSSRGENRDIEQALELGASDFLVKYRTRPEDVVAKVLQVLAHPTTKRVVSRYQLPVDPHSAETSRLLSDFGLPCRLQCGTCGRTLVFEMVPDFSHEEPWFSGRFVCPHCAPEPAPEPAQQKEASHGESPAH